MNREELIERICPKDSINANGNCETICRVCGMFLNTWLDEYDKHIRADTIKECMRAIVNAESKVINPCANKTWDELTLLAKRQFEILEILEQLKEKKNEYGRMV